MQLQRIHFIVGRYIISKLEDFLEAQSLHMNKSGILGYIEACNTESRRLSLCVSSGAELLSWKKQNNICSKYYAETEAYHIGENVVQVFSSREQTYQFSPDLHIH